MRISRKERGQSALEYAALITLLAGIVFLLVYGNNPITLQEHVNSTYSTVISKVNQTTGWYNNTIR